MVLLRHPNGELMAHSNQAFFKVDKYWESRIKEIFDPEYYPEMEDYTKPYTLSGEFPETGRVIEPSDNMPPQDNSPLCKITVSKADGSKEITVC